MASGNPLLTPLMLGLNQYAQNFELSELRGFGVLAGRRLEVSNGLDCDAWFGAFDSNQNFSYEYGDPRFAEAMSYTWGDRFMRWMEDKWAPAAAPEYPLSVVARCPEPDNAYYVKQGNTEFVCLGISTAASGANFSDDAQVISHEMQHGYNVHAYAGASGLNQFKYDEAGALNEALADVMALAFAEPEIAPPFDPRSFSRWALGSFWIAKTRDSHARGTHACPEYDPRFPNCLIPPSESGEQFSADLGQVTYVYPEGLGWPYNRNGLNTGDLRNAYLETNIHSVHGNSVLLSGAVWDVYQALRSSGGIASAVKLGALVQNALALLPVPSSAHLSPVNYRGFAQAMLVAAEKVLNFSESEISEIRSALERRGLTTNAPQSTLQARWLAVGPGAVDGAGVVQSPGVAIEDQAGRLKGWLRSLGAPESVEVRQTAATAGNGKLDAGELVTLWLDLKNLDSVSAGAVLVDVLLENVSGGPASGLNFVSGQRSAEMTRDVLNPGRLSATQAQIVYPKIHGTRIVRALTHASRDRQVPITNSFLGTDLQYRSDPILAFWVQADAKASAGKTYILKVRAQPSNGPAETISIPLSVGGL